jgi:kynurenine formamidase
MRVAPEESDVLSWFDGLSNWGRWGVEDERGTLNLITPAKMRAAAALVSEGKRLSCAAGIEPGYPRPVQRMMLSTGQGLADPDRVILPKTALRGDGGRYNAASDCLSMFYHGVTVTHIDALSHMFWDGRMYNDRPAELVTASLGATRNDVAAAATGVFTRGVLLDIARVRETPWLEAGEGVYPDDLEAAEDAAGVRAEAGDALLVRTGYGRRKRERGQINSLEHEGQPGLHAACLPWLHERGVALIACDTAADVVPSGYDVVPLPIHIVAIVAMGLWLVDNCDFEELASECSRLRRWEVLFTLDPLPISGGTGSPVNPIATL